MVEFVSISAMMTATSKRVDAVTRKIILDIDKGFSKRSPVDTGRFKANWMLGVNTQPTGYKWELTGKSSLGTVSPVVALHASQIPKKAAGNVYWLVNNLPYANALEYGHSRKQAPNGVVGITLVQFEGIVERSVRAVNTLNIT